MQNFVKGYGFLDFFVVTIIAGSILGMPRALLLKAGPRFIVPLLGCLIATFSLVGLLGLVTGFGFIEGILFIAAPIMAGGLGVGALPMSEMYAARTGGNSAAFRGDLMSGVARANIVCILIAGIYSGIGKRGIQPFVGFNGHGELMRIKGKSGKLTSPPKRMSHRSCPSVRAWRTHPRPDFGQAPAFARTQPRSKLWRIRKGATLEGRALVIGAGGIVREAVRIFGVSDTRITVVRRKAEDVEGAVRMSI